MTVVIARSRIGYWTAFETQGASWLNGRDSAGRDVTVRIDDAERDALAGPAGPAHDVARAVLSNEARHSATALPTPPIGPGEPQAHDWWPTRRPVEGRLAA